MSFDSMDKKFYLIYRFENKIRIDSTMPPVLNIRIILVMLIDNLMSALKVLLKSGQ